MRPPLHLALAVVASLPLVAPAAGAQRRLPPPSAGVLAGEMAGGAAGSMLGMVAGYGVGTVLDPGEHERVGPFVGMFAGALMGNAGGVTLVGTRGRAEGSLLAATGGSLAGAAAWLAVDRAVRRLPQGRRRRAAFVAASLLPAAGATVAFNLSRR